MGIGINVFICLLPGEILTLQHYIPHMDQNVKENKVNQICAAMREIDSYKYGLHSKVVSMVQVSILVFITEKCIDNDFNYIETSQDYKSTLLKGAWEQVMKFCNESDNKRRLYQDLFRKVEEFNPTRKECEDVLDKLTEFKGGREDFDSIAPSEQLADLAVELLDYIGGVVANPDAGDYTLGRKLNIGDNFYGATASEGAWSIGLAKMILQEKEPSRNYILSENGLTDIGTYNRYVNIFDSREFDYNDVFSNLSLDGKAVIMVLSRELVSQSSTIREILIKQNVLDKVIVLPTYALKRSMAGSSLLVCRLGRKENDPIIMLDASGNTYYDRSSRNTLKVSKIISDLENESCQNRVEVPVENIIEERYNLGPWVYMRPIEDVPEGYEVAALRDLTKPLNTIRQGKIFGEVATIGPSDLELNQMEYLIDSSVISSAKVRPGREPILLTKSCLLVNTTLKQVRAAYYKYNDGDQIYASTNIMLLEVDEKRIDPEFLVNKLRSIEATVGSSTVSSSYLWTYPIVYPSLEEQKRIVVETKRAVKQSKIRELGLTEEIQRLKNDYKTLIRTKKHNLGTVRGNISATVRQLQKQAEQAKQSGDIDLKALFNRVNRLVDYWKDLDGRLDRIADENKFKEAEEFAFDTYLKDLESNRVHSNYKLSYNLDKATFDSADAKFAINVNPDDFRQVVDNIISNAEKHGFGDTQREDYYLNISVYYDESETGDQRICFLFENNGYPAPEMTNAQFGIAGWHTSIKGSKGEGLGGAYISEMTRHFGGGYEAPQAIKDELGEYSKTRVLIYFPAIIDFDEALFTLKEYAFDTIYDIVDEHLRCDDYDINTGFEITFDPELEIYIKTLDELGYDLNDDYSVYFDENGRPYNSSEPESVHWINDITMVDENGQRVVNPEYVRKIVDRLLSRDKERICVISQ